MDAFFYNDFDSFYFDDLDYRLNNPVYPANPCDGLNPLDIFTAPGNHLCEQNEISMMVGGCPMLDTTSDTGNMEVGHMSVESDPKGGVVVTDIAGGQHHYADMEQAMRLSDVMSGFPVTNFSCMPTMSQSGNTTEVHTSTNLSFYNQKLVDAQSQLDDARRKIANCNDENELQMAIRQAEEARLSLRYWEDCRTLERYNQTMNNLRSDRLINDANKAQSDLHNTLYHF